MHSTERQLNPLLTTEAGAEKLPIKPEVAADKTPVLETETAISYLGVGLKKAKVRDGQFVPKRGQYEDYINDKEVALPMQRDIAVAFLSGEPMLIEGGTSLGKTTTIKKMAAELGWEVHYANLNGATDVEDLMGRYIPNPRKNKPEDPEYIFADGKVTSGLRQETGKVKVIILDEFNASAPNILIRLHEVLDSLERGGDVVLSEDASEAVPVNKERTKVIALMNPPGKGYFGREPLDPAQLRRWVYKKLPSDLPESTFSYSTGALFGTEQESQNITPDMFISAREQALMREQLQEIPGMREILEKYKEFHKAAKEILRNRKIAEDQPQPFTFDDRMEPRRVRDFVLRFYTGDINETFQQALRYYYSNKLESEDDRKELGELIRLVEYKPKAIESRRKGLDRETKEKTALIADIERLESEITVSGKVPESRSGDTETLLEKMEFAKKILGRDFLGPEAIASAFGFTLKHEQIPDMPYTEDQLKKAKELNEMLVLTIDKDKKGSPLTMRRLLELFPAIKDPETKADVKLLFEQKAAGSSELKDDCWFKDEKWFTEAAPIVRWRLVGRAPLLSTVTEPYGGKASKSTNYVQQTKLLREHLAVIGALTAEEGEECTDEQLAKIEGMLSGDWKKAANLLAQLKINKNHRRTPFETLYDSIVYGKVNDERLLEKVHDWSGVSSSDGSLVNVGSVGSAGADVSRWYPGHRYDDVGVVSLR